MNTFCSLLGAASLALFTGCQNNSVMLVPVEGPLAASPRGLQTTIKWETAEHGTLRVVLPDGEICTGKHTTIPEGAVASGFRMTFSSQLLSSSETLAGGYGRSSNLANKQYGQGLLVGNKGTVIQVEFFSSASSHHGFGLAQDNKGNRYKLVF